MKPVKNWLQTPAFETAMNGVLDEAHKNAPEEITAVAFMIHTSGGKVAVVRSGCTDPETLLHMMEALGRAFGAGIEIMGEHEDPRAVH